MSAVRDVVVIGSGPSGAAVVSAMINRGVRPLVIDSSSSDMPLDRVLSGSDPGLGTGFKTWNGSAAMYRAHPHSPLLYEDELTVRVANYFGGLSRVWGATYDQYREFRRWPHDCIPTQDDWNAVASLVPRTITGTSEDYGFTLRIEPRLRPLLRLGGHRSRHLTSRSTLAIETRLSKSNACQQVGECLTGCPHDSIWYAGALFQQWEASGRASVLRGQLVRSVTECASHVSISMRSPEGCDRVVHAVQVFLAAGPLGTASILVASDIASTITIRDSQTAFGGMMALRGSTSATESTHTLSHVWVRSNENPNFLAQVYPPDASHVQRIRAKLPPVPAGVIQRVNRRLFPFIAYLDSDHSGTLVVSRFGTGIRVVAGSFGVQSLMRRHIAGLARHVALAGFVLPPRPLEIAPPGGGFHFGASLPHGPVADRWGRPHGLKRVHVVDASVMPHIEAGSITPTVMANAYRIARTVPLLGTP